LGRIHASVGYGDKIGPFGTNGSNVVLDIGGGYQYFDLPEPPINLF